MIIRTDAHTALIEKALENVSSETSIAKNFKFNVVGLIWGLKLCKLSIRKGENKRTIA